MTGCLTFVGEKFYCLRATDDGKTAYWGYFTPDPARHGIARYGAMRRRMQCRTVSHGTGSGVKEL